MSWAHLHLMLSHLPVLGAPALFVLLAWGLRRRSREIVRVAFGSTVLLAAVTGGVFLTGEPAEDQLERQPGFNEQLVEKHEDLARLGTLAMLATGALAAAALWRGQRDPDRTSVLPRAVLAGLLASTALFAWIAWTGGSIGHPEIRTASVVEAVAGNSGTREAE